MKSQAGSTEKQTIKLDIPEDAIENSVSLNLSAVGRIVGTTLKNLNYLVRVPTGCGEQIMVKFVPNVLLVKYLKVGTD